MWSAWILGLTSTWLMASARSLPLFVMGALLYGITAFVMSPLNSYVTAARGRWSVGRAITLTQALYSTGAVAGPLLGGIIGNRYGLHKIYLFSAIVFTISTLIIFLIRPQHTEDRKSFTNRSLFTNRSFITFLVVIFIAVFAMYLPQPLASNYLQNQKGLEVNDIGLLGSVASLGNVALIFSSGFIQPIAGLIVGQILIGIFALFILRGASLQWFIIGYFLLGGYRAARAMVTAHVQKLVPMANMGLAYGMSDTVSGFAIILAPTLAGFLYGQEPDLVFSMAILFISISVITGIIYARKESLGSKS
jgi:MFS family permease